MGEERERLRSPQGLDQMTEGIMVPFTEIKNTGGKASLEEKMISMILNMLSWRSLWDTQETISRTQLELCD